MGRNLLETNFRKKFKIRSRKKLWYLLKPAHFIKNHHWDYKDWNLSSSVELLFIYQYVSVFFIYWMFEYKHLWYKDIHVMYMYHLLKVKLLLVLWCMTAHLKIKRNTDKFYRHKVDIFKASILSTFKLFHVF